MDIKDMPAKFLRCETGWDGRPGYTICTKPVAHIEVWNGHEWPPDHRFWCAACTPWSGHYEWCAWQDAKGNVIPNCECERLMKEFAVRFDKALETGELVLDEHGRAVLGQSHGNQRDETGRMGR